MKIRILFLFVAALITSWLFAQNNPPSAPATPEARAQVMGKLSNLQRWTVGQGFDEIDPEVVTGFTAAINHASGADLAAISTAIRFAGKAGGDTDYAPGEFLSDVLESVNSGESWKDAVYDTVQSYEPDDSTDLMRIEQNRGRYRPLEVDQGGRAQSLPPPQASPGRLWSSPK